MKNWQLVLIALCATLFFITAHNAYAVVNISWDASSHSIFDGNVSPFLGFPPATTSLFTVNDTSLAYNNVTDTINVLVNSTSDLTGITLTLTETGPNTGIFVNTNLIFTNGTGVFGIPSTQTIGINKPLLAGTGEIISGPSSSEGIQVFSTTDSTGIFMNLTETGSSTGIFTAKLKFTSGPSINGSSISVNPGDTVTIMDVNNLDVENELALPNPDPAFGALPANINDFVSAVYGGVNAATRLDAFTSPGGGGGGLIRPGLVLDFIGGSPFIVSPPSFGGGYFHYSDGLTITQDNDKTTFDTSKYNQEIPKQVMVTGQRVNMTFKTFESYNPTAVIHMGLYIIPRGQDMLTTNSIASIVYDKNLPVEVNDPNHILSKASASSTTDGKFQYTQFSFVPTKSYDKMSFLARAWNDHLYSTDIRVHDEVITPPAPRTLPTGVVLYNDYYNLQAALEKDQFYKPQIMAHIHSTTDVFSSTDGGHLYWLYDSINHSVTLVIEDSNDNELASFRASLDPFVAEKKGDYGFMQFTVKQLNRADEQQEKQAMEIEAAKAMFMALEKGLIVQSNWQS